MTTKAILARWQKKVHLAKMARSYVGIRKNHTDQIKVAKKVHLAEMDFFCHFSKVGLLAPALVIDIVIPSFFPCPLPTPPGLCSMVGDIYGCRSLKIYSLKLIQKIL